MEYKGKEAWIFLTILILLERDKEIKLLSRNYLNIFNYCKIFLFGTLVPFQLKKRKKEKEKKGIVNY